jgi:HAE1 family hydrophobic/amphiphilic exporter-1
MGTGVIGGMLAASFIAIFLIPMTFYIIEKMAHRKVGGDAPEQPLPSEQPLIPVQSMASEAKKGEQHA